MNNEVRELNDVEIEEVAGGMDCKTAIAVAQVYVSVGDVLKALGDKMGAVSFYGRANGVLQGGCPA